MTTEEIVAQIKAHPKFKDLHCIQQQRIIVAAGWTRHVMKGLKELPWRADDIIRIVRNHKTHTEFNGILLNIIANRQLKLF